jgi:O-antigen/teichoic acid export membrane protein
MFDQIKKVSAVSLGNIFNAVLGLTFLTAVARSLPIEDFGKYALLTTLLVGISKIVDFGTNSVYVAQSIAKDDDIKNIFVTSKIYLLAATVPVSILILYLLNLLEPEILVIFLIGLFAYGVNYTLFAFFQKSERFGFAVGLNTIPATIKFVAAVLILSGLLAVTVELAFLIFAGAIIFSSVLYHWLPDEQKGFEFTKLGVSEMIKESTPAGISIIIHDGWSAIANSVAKITKALTGVGIFSIADRIANVFTIISFSIFTVLLPKSARTKRNEQAYDIKETVILSLGILLLAVIAVSLTGFAVPLVFGEKFTASVSILNVLIFASALSAIHSFIENYFFVEEKTPVILGITLTRLFVFLTAAFLLIPIISLQGLAYAQLLAAIVALAITVFFVYRLRKS